MGHSYNISLMGSFAALNERFGLWKSISRSKPDVINILIRKMANLDIIERFN